MVADGVTSHADAARVRRRSSLATLSPATDRKLAFAKEDAAARQGLRAFISGHMSSVSTANVRSSSALWICDFASCHEGLIFMYREPSCSDPLCNAGNSENCCRRVAGKMRLLSLNSKGNAVGRAAAAKAQIGLTGAHCQTVDAREQQLLVLRWDAGRRCKLLLNFSHRRGWGDVYGDRIFVAKDVDLARRQQHVCRDHSQRKPRPQRNRHAHAPALAPSSVPIRRCAASFRFSASGGQIHQ